MRMACPSSSIDMRRLPRGVRPMRAIFLRWAKGSVCDLLLHSGQFGQFIVFFQGMLAYLTRSKIVTRFPTGENRQDPSGLKSRFPWL